MRGFWVPAPPQIRRRAPILNAKGEAMTTRTMPINLTNIEDEDQAAERWLTDTLAAARHRVQDAPSPEAVARMRVRILAETSEAESKAGKIAA
jgi:bacillopeptidase F (M6 metalloprotease family)